MNTSSVDELRCTPDNTVYVTDNVTAATLMYTPRTTSLIRIIMMALLLVGVLGNGVFLLTVYRVERMRNVTNAYLCNVAISDFIFLIYTVFVYTITLSVHNVKGGFPVNTSSGCVLITFLPAFSYYLSVTLITLVSLERFFAICLPLSNWSLSGKSRTKKVIAIAWIVPVLLSPAWSVTMSRIQSECIVWPNDEQYKGLRNMRYSCDVISTSVSFRVYCISFAVVSYTIFLLPNLIMYGSIIRTLGRRNASKMSEDSRKIEVTEVRNQVARLLIALGTVFFICQTPERIFVILDHLNKLGIEFLTGSTETGAFFFFLSKVLVAINCVINPYLYLLFSKSYRDSYLEALNLKKGDSQQWISK